MFSKFFIQRPVFASVISIIISLVGFIALINLPIEQYPSLTPPTVQVSTVYPGADAQTISTTIASVIENAINGVDNMIYMDSSSSSSGAMNLTVYFDIGTNIDQAVIDVNNRISSTIAKMPDAVKKFGITVTKTSQATLSVISMYSNDASMDVIDIYNYTNLNILDELKRIPGVADASAIGGQNYSLRIWLKPDLLKKFNITTADIIFAVNEQNAQYPTGKIGEEPLNQKSPYVYSITMQGILQNPSEFENIILRKNDNGSFLRLKEVADIEIGSQQYNFKGRLNGKDAVPIIINLQSGANALNTAKLVEAKMEELSKNFPKGLEYKIPYDTTKFVLQSIKEVIKTFVEALILVLIVVYMFLKNFRATLIPMIAIPVSLLGTFLGLYLLGFSINLLTLFALILAIGIVVDDAIIVVENIDRILHQDKNISVKEAALKAMKEVSSPVISIVLVLCAVFIPVSFISGFVGEIQKQFALTLAISVSISGFVALTLTPSLCALFLKREEKKPFYLVYKFNQFFDQLTLIFSAGVAYILRRTVRFFLIFCIMIGAIFYLYKTVPSSLIPEEDQGLMLGVINLPSASALHRTILEVDRINEEVLKTHAIKDTMTMIGFDLFSHSLKENAAVMFIGLQDYKDRNMSVDQIAMQLNKQFIFDRNSSSIFLGLPPIPGLSTTGGFEMYIQNRSAKSYEQIQADIDNFVIAANQRKELARVRTTLDTSFAQYKLIIDRDKLKYFNLNMQDVFNTINASIGTYYINDFSMLGKNFQVNIRARGDFRNTQNALKNLFVRSNDGHMVSLDSFLSLQRSLGSDDIKRFNLFPAAQIQGQAAAGYTSGQAIQALLELAKQELTQDYSIAWSGSAYQEISSKQTGLYAFILGIIFVFLILAAQYERWLMPLAVISSVPFAVFGSFLFVYLRGFSNDIYFQTGLLLLIGLCAKNAILMIEFAMEERYKRGKTIFEAAIEAAKLRFRPIIMTSLAFSFGVLPMLFASGAGSASRHSLGTALIGGMIAASTVAVFFIPLFFYLLQNFSEWLKRGKNYE